jgi:hypothetical protein
VKTTFPKPAKTATAVTRPARVADEAATETESTTALVETQDKALAFPATSGLEGEINTADFQIPKLNIANKTGELSNEFPPGSIVFRKEVAVGDQKKPASLVLLRLSKKYMQRLPYGTDERPKIFATAADVRTAGGTLDITESDMDVYDPILTVTAAVQAPEKNHPLFTFEHKGNHYALAQMLLAKSAYNNAGKQLITEAATALRTGLAFGKYELTTSIRSNQMGSWFTPVFRLASKNNEEDAAWFAGLI